MKALRSLLLVILLTIMATSNVLSQSIYTPFVTSITYQNVGTASTTVTFNFYVQGSASPIPIYRQINPGAGGSFSVNSSALGLPNMFLGSVVMSANQNVIGTLVQVPDSISVKNRLLTNAFKTGSSKIYLPTLLKKRFNATSKFSIQNASSDYIDFTVKVFSVSDTLTPAYTPAVTSLPPGSVKYFVMGEGTVGEGSYGDPNMIVIPAPDGFEGYAVVEAFKAFTTIPSYIVGTVFELTQNEDNFSARAYEGIASGATTLYMATALCKVNNASTAYAVQNISTSSSAPVVVTYSNNQTYPITISPNGKVSINACATVSPGFSGAAKITSSGGQIVAIGKAGWDNPSVSNSSFGTAFIGETQGSAKLALPYVRYTQDPTYNNGSRQRAYLAIQNVGSSTVSNVQVKYLNNDGILLGTHWIFSIAANGKANSKAIDAVPTTPGDADKLKEFGYPPSNPDGGYGGAVLIEASSGSQLIAIARLQTRDTNTTLDVAEDYNAIPVP